MKKDNQPEYMWKFLKEDSKGRIISGYDSSKWKIGEWRKTRKSPVTCEVGFHASKELYQAYSYVSGTVLAKVEVAGKYDHNDDKSAYQEMRIVQAWKWDKATSVKLAIYAAEQVIAIYEKKYPKDDRPRKAIQAAKKWLKTPNKEAAAAAYAAYAAYDANAANAAYAAAAYAAYAAYAAAAYAAYAANAANANAAYAAYAAYAANAKSGLIKKINAYMKKLAKDLEEIK